MMNRDERFEAWAARARQETVPSVDVVAGVVHRIQAGSPRRESDMPWYVCSGLSVLAASVMLVVALDSWQSLTDPLAGLFSSLTMVMQ